MRNGLGQSTYDQIITYFLGQSSVYIDSMNLSEWHIYGSSRLGIYQTSINMAYRNVRIVNGVTTDSTSATVAMPSYTLFDIQRGSKRYELTNHLGNVLAVVSDKKIQVCTSTTISYYTADLVSAADYSPFGAPLDGRSYTAPNISYRFGFNGKERDNETYGEGNAYDFGARICDVRLGRFLSVDPLVNKYPYLSPYLFAGNTPIMAIDLDGLDKFEVVITPDANNAKLTKVEVRKVEICTETVVVYVHKSPQGNEVLREAPTSNFKPNSVEEYFMKQQFENSGKTRSEAMNVTIIKDGKVSPAGPLTNKSNGKALVGATLFQYDLSILFKSDKSAISANDLQEGTFEQATADINALKNILVTKFPYTAMTGDSKIADFSRYNMVVNGETDSKKSNYNNGCGNPCLGQDRANSLLSELQVAHPNKNSTNVINNVGAVKKEDRKASVFLTP